MGKRTKRLVIGLGAGVPLAIAGIVLMIVGFSSDSDNFIGFFMGGFFMMGGGLSIVMVGAMGKMVKWNSKIWGKFSSKVQASKAREGKPKKILKQRLARGEITPAEYARLKRVLKGDDSAESPPDRPASEGICPFCGTPTQAGAKFCESCGQPLH